MIRLTGVSKVYGAGPEQIRALDEVTLEVKPNEFAAITGPSGSGKTTLLNLIGGMTRPDSGVIQVAGQDLSARSDPKLSRLRTSTIGFMFQIASLLPALDALDNVRLPGCFAGQGDNTAAASRLLAEVGLADRIHAAPHQLSAGQQRRVCLARALVNRPALLLCDEPTGDLDPETEAAIMALIARAHQAGATVLLTTHNHALAAAASRRLFMTKGKIHEQP